MTILNAYFVSHIGKSKQGVGYGRWPKIFSVKSNEVSVVCLIFSENAIPGVLGM